MKEEELKNIAKDVRRDILKMVNKAKSGHVGGSLSAVEVMVALYFEIMDINVDKFVLSKGHASPLYYSILARKGFIDLEDLDKLRNISSNLEGHPTNKINGVDVSTGSLGQGLSVACGMALSKKLYNDKGYVYCLCGDGEMEEGQIWEAIMSANKYKLNNLVLFIDNNSLQIDGKISFVKGIDSFYDKIASFGFFVREIDGHNIKQIVNTVNVCKKQDKPVCIILKTIKGKGVNFMENEAKWHGKAPNDEELSEALKQL